jgi:hypothetical protein
MVRSWKIALFKRPFAMVLAATLAASASAMASTETLSITLAWTAPGDNGVNGTASAYDLRYSTSPITGSNFASATQAIGMPAPAPAGTRQSAVVNGLQASTTYYFALKTADAAGNWSAMSNVVVYTPEAPAESIQTATPLAFSLPRPNPAKDLTQFVFDLPQPSAVLVEVLDVVGRRVRLLANELRPSGHNVIEWRLDDSASNRVPPGFYFVRARAMGQDFLRRLVVVH